MEAPRLQGSEFWRVNSYSYPNFFSDSTRAHEAWDTFCSFFEHDKKSYKALKKAWESGNAPREIEASALESWKATFEEFGLLYVISRSDTISVTPAGRQFHAAVKQDNPQQFVWIGLNLLFRYPLKGPPRNRPTVWQHIEITVSPAAQDGRRMVIHPFTTTFGGNPRYHRCRHRSATTPDRCETSRSSLAHPIRGDLQNVGLPGELQESFRESRFPGSAVLFVRFAVVYGDWRRGGSQDCVDRSPSARPQDLCVRRGNGYADSAVAGG